MRHVFMVLALTGLVAPAAAQQPRGPGRGPALPEAWLPFDSLSQALRLSDDQLAAVKPLYGQIDSIVRRGAEVRTEMRQEMQRNPDREQAQRFMQRLQTMQQRVDRLMNDLKERITNEQKSALEGVRAPMVTPPRRGRPGGGQ